MLNIHLRDSSGLDLQIEPAEMSAFAKYFENISNLLITAKTTGSIVNWTLEKPAITSFQADLNFGQPVRIKMDNASVSFKSQISGNIGIFVPRIGLPPEQADTLFSGDEYGEEIPVAPVERYVSFAFTGTISASFVESLSSLQFGFDSDTTFSLINYRKFSTNPTAPSVLDAIQETVTRFTLPGSSEDLKAMPLDSIVALSGSGSLQFSATASLSVVHNLLTLPDLPLIDQVGLPAGASISVSGSYRLSGRYQLRVHKTGPQTIRFGYFKEHSAEWVVTASANAGPDFAVSGSDVFAQVLSAISPNTSADLSELKTAEVDTDDIAAMQATVQASIQRTLELAVTFELGNIQEQSAAFLYEADLVALDTKGQQAINNALRGDLTGLSDNTGNLPAGIRMIHSIYTKFRDARHVLKVNLLGLYNFVSVSRKTLTGQMLFNPESGELVLTDSATAHRITAELWTGGGAAKAVNPQKLQNLLASSFLLTAIYRASGLIVSPPSLTMSQTYCRICEKANIQTTKGELNVAVGLGLMTVNETINLLKDFQNFGRTLVYASASYDDLLATAMFLRDEKPRSQSEYEAIGRQAMQMAVRADSPSNDFRLKPLVDMELWERMKQTGQTGFGSLFHSLTAAQVGVIAADYSTIQWWAQTMSDTAQKLAEIRSYVRTAKGGDDDHFQKLRQKFAEYLKKVAASTRDEFGQPWGLLVTDLLTGNRSDAEIVFTGPVLSFSKKRKVQS